MFYSLRPMLSSSSLRLHNTQMVTLLIALVCPIETTQCERNVYVLVDATEFFFHLEIKMTTCPRICTIQNLPPPTQGNCWIFKNEPFFLNIGESNLLFEVSFQDEIVLVDRPDCPPTPLAWGNQEKS